MYDRLLAQLDPGIVSRDEPMQSHTTFRIGGPADVLVTPSNIQELKTALKFCRDHDLPVFVFGAGSNLLVGDRGIRGVTIKIGTFLNQVRVENNRIYAQAGVGLGNLARQAALLSLSGLEFAEGIPGSLGGAVVMNAGAYGGEMSQIVTAVEAVSPTGEERTFQAAEIGFGYRESIFQHNGYLVTAAYLELHPGERSTINQTMLEYAKNRRAKQPLEFPSAGSVFRRPPGYFVGPMLEQLGLKGYRIGGAEVSQKHAGFIINTGSATARDVLDLIAHVKRVAKENLGVELETEIRVIGDL
ncbi:MAG: UDP-N-acetylmuramate dehydrogenase [Syntrophomonadaceae bacterium]